LKNFDSILRCFLIKGDYFTKRNVGKIFRKNAEKSLIDCVRQEFTISEEFCQDSLKLFSFDLPYWSVIGFRQSFAAGP
jgi:hypothetical protein